MQIYFQTDVGLKRDKNEDCVNIFRKKEALLAVLADGMGGHKAGEIASKMALDSFKKYWEELDENFLPEMSEQWLLKAVERCNTKLFKHSQNNEECQGMGTTVVVVICTETFITICHVGDSRGYLLGTEGLTQLTEDHSFANYLMKSENFSIEDARSHPRKNMLTRALGTEPIVKADVASFSFEEGAQLLLCSDGLYGKVLEEEISETLLGDENLHDKGEKLINRAKENGGEDNISIILLKQGKFENRGEYL